MTELADFSAVDLAAAMRARRASPVEVLEATLARLDARRGLNAFMAVCAERARAEAVAAEAMGLDAVRMLWEGYVASSYAITHAGEEEWLARWSARAHSMDLLGVLETVAKMSPDTANDLLGEALSAGLIDGSVGDVNFGSSLKVLDLSGRDWIRSLPGGLKLDCYVIDLHDCVNLDAIPKGFRTDGQVILTGCRAWDGRIPPDAAIGGGVITDVHPEWVDLELWREQHPDGEKAVRDAEA